MRIYNCDEDCASHRTVSGDGYASCNDLGANTWVEVVKVNLNGV